VRPPSGAHLNPREQQDRRILESMYGTARGGSGIDALAALRRSPACGSSPQLAGRGGKIQPGWGFPTGVRGSSQPAGASPH
jgi:hypothetical protein